MVKKVNAFTLIELLVSMTILFSIMFLTYIPYNHYQNKAKLKLTSREISQSFYEAKTMAVSWVKDETNNRAMWIYIENVSWNNTYLTFFSYPHDIETDNINNIVSWDIKIIKVKEVQPWVRINNLWWHNNLLFFFESITWKSRIYTFTWAGKTEILDTQIPIMFSYKDAISPTLQRRITYFTETNIVDYN